jgi:hypothetical protein
MMSTTRWSDRRGLRPQPENGGIDQHQERSSRLDDEVQRRVSQLDDAS